MSKILIVEGVGCIRYHTNELLNQPGGMSQISMRIW